MKQEFEILIPAGEFSRLQRHGALKLSKEHEDKGNSFGGLKRATRWILNCDCAFLSGWHEPKDEKDDETRRENRLNNDALQHDLREKGYGVIRAIGNYGGSRERSFLTFDISGDTARFRDDIVALGERFRQESVLFKEAGENKEAYYYYTWGARKGERESVGLFSVCPMRDENFTIIGKGKIVFEKPTTTA